MTPSDSTFPHKLGPRFWVYIKVCWKWVRIGTKCSCKTRARECSCITPVVRAHPVKCSRSCLFSMWILYFISPAACWTSFGGTAALFDRRRHNGTTKNYDSSLRCVSQHIWVHQCCLFSKFLKLRKKVVGIKAFPVYTGAWPRISCLLPFKH